MLTIIDEYTRECLAIVAKRKLKSDDVLKALESLFIDRGMPGHFCSDNGSEFTAKAVRSWFEKMEVKPIYIESGSPWENGYDESFNGRLRDELLDRELFDTLQEAQVLIQRWRVYYNPRRRHSSIDYLSGDNTQRFGGSDLKEDLVVVVACRPRGRQTGTV